LPHAVNPQAAANNTAVNAKCPARIFRFSQNVLKGTTSPASRRSNRANPRKDATAKVATAIGRWLYQ
jgi:hypothetical protein